jgi:tetratricopeptide (TPR) repeat protein
MLNRNDSPWYDSVTLYRQDDSRQWESILEKMAGDLFGLDPAVLVQLPYLVDGDSQFDSESLVHQIGLALLKQNKNLDALPYFERLVRNKSGHDSALHYLGVISYNLGDSKLAVDWMLQSIEINPGNADVFYDLGIALQAMGLEDQARTSYEQAIAIKPEFVQAHYNLGNVEAITGEFDRALVCYEQAISLDTRHYRAWYNRGNVLQNLKRYDQAIGSYERVIELKPEFAEAYNNLGNALREINKIEEAQSSYESAISIDEKFADAYNNLGNTLYDFQKIIPALASFDKAIAIRPDYAEAYWNKSLALLLDGQLRAGFEMFEWRWKTEKTGLKPRELGAPLWLGEHDIAGKTLLLHSEQGLGDSIQFCRYAKLAKERGARVIMLVPKPLINLLQSLEGVDELVEIGQPVPAFDYHCPMLSLPLAFKTDLDNIPLSRGYLRADPLKSEAWGKRLGAKERLRVGVVWSGGVRPDRPELWAAHKRRNVELVAFAKALAHLEVDFYSLQKGEPAESEIRGQELAYWPKGNFYNYADELKDFSDTAALIDNLDLVIAVDTSTAHLAAAMGKPTWILNRYDTCWRWMLNRNDSPWYDSVTLYRQDDSRQWESILEKMAVALQQNFT